MTTTTKSTIVERPLVLLNGVRISEQLEHNLIDTRVELVTNGVAQATLRFYDADFELLGASIKIGAKLAVAFPKPASKETVQVFKGEIMVLAAEQSPNDLHDLVVTAFDGGYRMSRAVVPVAWTNVTYADILRKIAQQNKLSAQIAGTPPMTFPHLLQTTDDLTFLTDVVERAGVSWRIVDEKLVVGGAAPPDVAVKWGVDLRRFSTRVSGAGPSKEIEVRGWDVRTKRAHVGKSAKLSTRLSSAATSTSARGASYGLSSTKRVVANRITESQDEATMIANSMRERLDSGLTQARGEAEGNPALLPGAKLTVSGMGAAFSGDYQLTTVEHVYSAAGYVTRFHAGPLSASTMVDLLDGPSRTFHGATIGVVTNNNDPDLKSARVKVKLPMFGDAVESDWARVVTLGGGPSRGLQITPAVNDEVLVIFEGGDLRRPIVLGGVWGGTDQPPKPTTETTKGGETMIWHLQTKAGHQLTFDDRPEGGKENVTVLLKDGKTKLYLGRDKIELWSAGQSIEVKSGAASIKLDKNDVTVDAVNVNIKAQAAVKIEGSTIDIAAKGPLKMNGGMVEVKGTGMVNVESTAVVIVKGVPVKIN